MRVTGPTATPRPMARLQEGDIGSESVLDPTATPTATCTASMPPEFGTPSPGPRTTPPAESLLTHISATTPPNTIAALRLVEDGRVHLEAGRYDRALERFERAVAIDPTNGYGYYYLALLHFQMKKYDQAVALAARAAAFSGKTDPIWRGRSYALEGTIYEEVGRFADARRAYQRAIVADPNNSPARAGLARLSEPPPAR